MDLNILKETITASITGSLKFPQIVGMLIEQKVESYHVDFVRAENRYYSLSGESVVLPVAYQFPSAALNFSAEGVKASIKKSQQGLINYKTFIQEVTTAGCIYYITYLKGKRVIYFGREGDFHVEHFPRV